MGFNLSHIFSGLSQKHLESIALGQLADYLTANKADLLSQANVAVGPAGDQLTAILVHAVSKMGGPWGLIASGLVQLVEPYIAGLVASGESDLPGLFDKFVAAVRVEAKKLG